MVEYLYDMDKVKKLIYTDLGKDEIIYSSLKNIGVNVNTITLQDIFLILDDLESLCDNKFEVILSTEDVSRHYHTLLMKSRDYIK